MTWRTVGSYVGGGGAGGPATQIREAGGATLNIGVIADGQVLQRAGSSVVGGAGGGGGGAAGDNVFDAAYTCTSAELVGNPVYASSADNVRNANAASSATGPAIGFVTAKASSTSCTVAFAGEVSGLAGLAPGAIYYLAVGGGITSTPPSATGNIVQQVGVAKDATTLVLGIDGKFIQL